MTVGIEAADARIGARSPLFDHEDEPDGKMHTDPRHPKGPVKR
jgi:hypothetical protein